jgi:hypothetical protein
MLTVTLDDRNLIKTTQLTLDKIKLLGGNDDGRDSSSLLLKKQNQMNLFQVLQSFLDDMIPTIIKGLHDARSR